MVLLCFLLLWVVFLGTFPFSSVGWCFLASSLFGCCCFFAPLFLWCCLSSLPWGGAVFPLSVGLGFLHCWAVGSGVGWFGGYVLRVGSCVGMFCDCVCVSANVLVCLCVWLWVSVSSCHVSVCVCVVVGVCVMLLSAIVWWCEVVFRSVIHTRMLALCLGSSFVFVLLSLVFEFVFDACFCSFYVRELFRDNSSIVSRIWRFLRHVFQMFRNCCLFCVLIACVEGRLSNNLFVTWFVILCVSFKMSVSMFLFAREYLDMRMCSRS